MKFIWDQNAWFFFCCKCKNKFSIHFSIKIKIVQILYCSAIISSKFLPFFWKKMTVFTYIPMHSCLNACEKFQTVTSNLELRTSSCSMSENTCFVAQTGFWVADSTSVENVRLHLQKQKYHMNKVYLRVFFLQFFFKLIDNKYYMQINILSRIFECNKYIFTRIFKNKNLESTLAPRSCSMRGKFFIMKWKYG